MKLAYQTITCGPFIPDLRSLMKQCQRYGYKGLELAQPISMVYETTESEEPIDIETLVSLCIEFDLKIVGIAGGSQAERVSLAKELISKKHRNEIGLEYIYLDEAPSDAALRLSHQHGLIIGLHPHIYKPIGSWYDAKITAAATYTTDANLRIIPDTAHLFLTGVTVEQLIEDPDILLSPAIHLKNWRYGYGNSLLLYANGFAPLSKGDIDITMLFDYLNGARFSNWIVVEVDYHKKGWAYAAWDGAHYLGFTKEDPPEAFEYEILDAKYRKDLSKLLLLETHCDYKDFLIEIGNSLAAIFGSDDFAILSEIREHEFACFFESEPNFVQIDEKMQANLKRCKIPESYSTYYLVPLHNPKNINHINYVYVIQKTPETSMPRMRELVAFTAEISSSLDSKFLDRSRNLSGFISHAASMSIDMSDFLGRIGGSICKKLGFDSFAIYIPWDSGSSLTLKSTDEKSIWQNYQTIVFGSEPNEVAQFIQEVASISRIHGREFSVQSIEAFSCLVYGYPLVISDLQRNREGNSNCGCLLCTRKDRIDESERDVAVLVREILAGAMPFIDLLREREYLKRGIKYVTHDCAFPLTNIVNVQNRFKREARMVNFSPQNDYFEETKNYAKLVARLLLNVDKFGRPDWIPECNFRISSNVLGEVVAPAVMQFLPMIERSIGTSAASRVVEFRGADGHPPVSIDGELLQQLLFNLISNAWKYRHPYIKNPQIKVFITVEETTLNIHCEDNGLGVPSGFEQQIFEREERGPAHQRLRIDGLGIGLWVAGRVAEAHGGRLFLKNSGGSDVNRTEFVVELPLIK